MAKGKTSTGFEYEVDERRLKDKRFVKLYSKMRKDPSYLQDLEDYVLGEEQAEALDAHCMDDEGYISVETVSNEFGEILLACAEAKN